MLASPLGQQGPPIQPLQVMHPKIMQMMHVFCLGSVGVRNCLVLQDVVVNERRFKYEGQVKEDPLNYDAWFDYIRLEESAGDHDKIREVRKHLTMLSQTCFSCIQDARMICHRSL